MQYRLVELEAVPTVTKDPFKEMSLVEVFKICNKMEKLCLDEGGIGLSAVQVGLPWNLFIIQRNNSFEYYANCFYEPSGEETTSIEGCLSIRDEHGSIRRFELKRYSSVTVKGQKLSTEGAISAQEFSALETGLYGVVFQHEIDHSFGIFIKDKGKEIYIF
jgi:peptide deformylase